MIKDRYTVQGSDVKDLLLNVVRACPTPIHAVESALDMENNRRLHHSMPAMALRHFQDSYKGPLGHAAEALFDNAYQETRVLFERAIVLREKEELALYRRLLDCVSAQEQEKNKKGETQETPPEAPGFPGIVPEATPPVTSKREPRAGDWTDEELKVLHMQIKAKWVVGQAIAAFHANGSERTKSAISQRFYAEKGRLQRRGELNQVEEKKPEPKNWTPDTIEFAVAMYSEGEPLKTIAETMNRHEDEVLVKIKETVEGLNYPLSMLLNQSLKKMAVGGMPPSRIQAHLKLELNVVRILMSELRLAGQLEDAVKCGSWNEEEDKYLLALVKMGHDWSRIYPKLHRGQVCCERRLAALQVPEVK